MHHVGRAGLDETSSIVRVYLPLATARLPRPLLMAVVMLMKKAKIIVFAVVLAVLAFEYFQSPKVEVDNSVRPYLEKYLDAFMRKDHDIVYETYLRERAVPLDEFKRRMNYYVNIFGALPTSYSYQRSYVGGVAYYIQYKLVLSNGRIQACSFSFPANEGNPIGVKDLKHMSVSADFGEKEFSVDFRLGKILACKSPDGCYGEN